MQDLHTREDVIHAAMIRAGLCAASLKLQKVGA